MYLHAFLAVLCNTYPYHTRIVPDLQVIRSSPSIFCLRVNNSAILVESPNSQTRLPLSFPLFSFSLSLLA